MDRIYLEIGELDTLMAFLEDAKKAGFLKNVSLDQVRCSFEKKAFPIRVPVDLTAILAAAGKPVIRTTFGKSIEKKTVDILNAALGAG